MALRLLSSGHQVWLYNRTASKLKPLELMGAIPCQSPLELAQSAEGIVLMLTDIGAIRELLLSTAIASDPSPWAGRTVIQMGTIAPEDSQQLQQEFGQRGTHYIEAPVLGSIPEAKAGKLIVMVGAEPDQYRQWEPLLTCFGSTLHHVGPVGTAAALKLAMNQLIGALTTAFAESLGMVQRAGIDPDLFMDVLRRSALYAPTFDKKLRRMQTRNFADPNFPIKHLLKDLRLFVRTAEQLGLATAPVVSMEALLEQAVRDGMADDDYSALFNLVNPLHPES